MHVDIMFRCCCTVSFFYGFLVARLDVCFLFCVVLFCKYSIWCIES